jgi:CRISPR/Cas system-associated endonuclease Cas3-HD|uniref:Uncharacterized protein n=1 Tax=viral metagenome TaxID=1070528 RepID=A0A6C0CKJ2_9ZZZZ
MEWLKIKPDVPIKKNPLQTIERRKPIPLDVSPCELLLKIRKKELSVREKEIDKYIEDIEILNNGLNNLNKSIRRVKSITEIAQLKQQILSDSCNF